MYKAYVKNSTNWKLSIYTVNDIDRQLNAIQTQTPFSQQNSTAERQIPALIKKNGIFSFNMINTPGTSISNQLYRKEVLIERCRSRSSF